MPNNYKKYTFIIAIISIFVSGISLLTSYEANKLSRESLEQSKYAFTQIQRPKLVIDIVPFDEREYLSLHWENKETSYGLIYTVKIKNIGKTTAQNILVKDYNIEFPYNEKLKKCNMELSFSPNLYLDPDQEYIESNVTNKIKLGKDELIKEYFNGECYIKAKIMITYIDPNTQKEHYVSGEFVIKRNNVIKYSYQSS